MASTSFADATKVVIVSNTNQGVTRPGTTTHLFAYAEQGSGRLKDVPTSLL